MTQYILKNHSESNILIVFANTGKERPETLDFVKKCSEEWNVHIHWIEYNPQEKQGYKNWFKVVDYETASRNGEPFEKFIKKERLPNSAYPNCSGRLKQRPLQNYAKHYFKGHPYCTAIGIRYDEQHRIKWDSAQKNKYWYPLAVDFPITKEFIHNYWSSQTFTLNLKSYEGNCDCCWKKSNRKLYTIAKESPEYFEWWAEMEEKNGDGFNFFRNNRSAKEILEESKKFPLKYYAKCDTKTTELKNNQLSFFDLDNESKCNCLY